MFKTIRVYRSTWLALKQEALDRDLSINDIITWLVEEHLSHQLKK